MAFNFYIDQFNEAGKLKWEEEYKKMYAEEKANVRYSKKEPKIVDNTPKLKDLQKDLNKKIRKI